MSTNVTSPSLQNPNIQSVYDEASYPSFRVGKPLDKTYKNIKADNLFEEDNNKSPFGKKDDAIKYINSLSINGLRSFKLLLHLISEEVALDIPFIPNHFQENNKDYYKVKIDSKKVNTSCMVQTCPLVEKIINHYRLGIGRFDLSFKELIDHLKKN